VNTVVVMEDDESYYRAACGGCFEAMPAAAVAQLLSRGVVAVCMREDCGAENVVECATCENLITRDDFSWLAETQRTALLPGAFKPAAYGVLGVVCEECQDSGLHHALSGQHHEAWHDAAACITCRAAGGEDLPYWLPSGIEARIRAQMSELLRRRDSR
jgi:hypothetical protein